MNQFALLLLVVVGASAAPTSDRKTVLSMALDLLPDLQAVFADGPPVKGVDGASIDGVTKAFTVFLPIVRQVLQAEAVQEKREVDSKTIATLERVQRLIPGVINLIGAASSGSPLGVDLEFALPDFTNHILGAAVAGNVPQVSNDISTDGSDSFSTPSEPVNAAPQVPINAAPQVPAFVVPQVSTQPDSTTYNGPSVPVPHLSPAYVPSHVNLQAPAAVFPNQYDFAAALNAAKESEAQQSRGVTSDAIVRYAAPGGGFFYSIGY